jgi:hypothetical protein
MSGRFCGLALCSMACLTAGLTSNVSGGDNRTEQTVGTAFPGDSRIAMETPLTVPTFHDDVPDAADLNDGHFYQDVGNPDFRPVGTIGQTYTRVSHAIPIDKHPRTAMLAVKDRSTIPYLSVGVMGGVKMKNGIWLFESTRPLDPGVCQIVRVEARQTPQDVEPYAVRFVRLIPGRIVYLDF